MPLAVFDIEEEGAGGVGNFGGVFVREAVAEVIFGEEDLAALVEFFRFVLAEPENFGGREAGEGGVGDPVYERGAATGEGDDFGALGGGALVVPEEGGAEDFSGGVEENGAVHLAGKTDGANGGGFYFGLFDDGGGGEFGGFPPAFGVLFGPAGFGGEHDVRGFGGGENLTGGGEEEGFGAGGSDIDSEEGHGVSRDFF